MINATAARARYREILEGDAVIYTASVFDPISAQIAEDIGYEVGNLSSTLASAEVLGTRAQSILTSTELAEQTRRITRASGLSIHLDAEHAGHDAVTVRRAIEEFEHAGAAAIFIEDGHLPVPYGFLSKAERDPGDRFRGPMIPLEEGVAKLGAALAARSDPQTVIAMRTNALFDHGVDEAIRRAAAYRAAGADAISIVSPTREAVEAVHREVDAPLVIAPSEDLRDRAFLSAHGVRVALNIRYPFEASIKALHDTYLLLREDVPLREIRPLTADPRLLIRATREEPYLEWNQRYWS